LDWLNMTKIDWLDVAENLRKAARYIEEHGWTRGIARNENGHVCVSGALRYGAGIMYSSLSPTPEVILLLSVISEQADRLCVDLIAYNDHYARNASDVIRCFEKAAVRAEERAGLD
jgi:hypothetical protein